MNSIMEYFLVENIIFRIFSSRIFSKNIYSIYFLLDELYYGKAFVLDEISRSMTKLESFRLIYSQLRIQEIRWDQLN